MTQQAYEKSVVDVNGNQVFVGPDGNDYSLVSDPNTGSSNFFDSQGNPAPQGIDFTNTTPKTIKFDPNKLPAHYSSDQRLSGFGTLSGGVTVTKQFAKGVTLETGFEYYTHQGALKLGGGGEAAYANYDYWVANAALKVNLEALSFGGSAGDTIQSMTTVRTVLHAPAGVMFDHMLPKTGDFMAGYRFMWNSQSGNMLNGSNPVSDAN